MKQPAKNIYQFSFFNFAGTIIGFSIILLLWQASAASVYGQSQPNLSGVDTTFTPKFSRTGSIWKSLPQPDGKIVLIGNFNRANGVESRNLVRLNPDYSIDETFNPPSNISVASLELLPDGKLICHAYGAGIFRLNPDGSVDPSFNFGRSLQLGGDYDVRLKPRSDGKIIVFGRFKAKKQRLVVAEDFMLLDQFGGIESGFRPSYAGFIRNVFPLPDGRTILTGTFEISRAAGQTVGRNFAVLDENGSPVPGFDGFYGKAGESVDGARVQPDGRILLYGTFTEVSKQTVLGRAVSKNKWLLRLNADGSFDRDFSFSPTAPRFSLSTVFLQPDGGIIITGSSELSGGEIRAFVSRLFPDGSPDNFFNNNLPFQPATQWDPSLVKMEMTADGGWLMSGNFRVTGRPEMQKLIKLNSNGTLDESFRTPPIIGGSGVLFHPMPGGGLLICGAFGKIGSRTWVGTARLNPNGSLNESFRFDVTSTGSERIHQVVAQPDGKSLIYGDFGLINGEYVHNPADAVDSSRVTYKALIRLNPDGTPDNSFAPLINSFAEIFSVVVQPDGKIIIGGLFSYGLFQNFLVRLNPDGTPDLQFNRVPVAESGGVSVVKDVAVLPDGKILFVGFFSYVAGVPRTRIARLMPDGSLDETFDFPNYSLHHDLLDKIILQPDGKAVIGGEMVNAFRSPGLARFNRSGTLDPGFRWNQIQVPTHTKGMQFLPDGNFLFNGQIGGYGFELYHADGLALLNRNGEVVFRYNVAPRKFLRQWDGKIILLKAPAQPGETAWTMTRIFPQGGADNTFNISFDRKVVNFAAQPDGRLLVAGEFTTVNGFRQPMLVRLNP